MPAHGIAVRIYRTIGLLALVSLSGCAMCASDLDCYYPAYGGKRAREDMIHGRVGSINDPAQETTESHLVDPSDLPDHAPIDADPTPADSTEAESNGSDEADKEAKDTNSDGPEIKSPFRSEPSDSDVPEDAADADSLLDTALADPVSMGLYP